MNLAIYQPRVSYYVGGGEIVPLQHAHFLSLLGHGVTIITTRASFIKLSEYFLKFIKANPKVKIKYLDLPLGLKWIYDELPGQRWIRWDYESLHVGRLAFAYFLKNKFDLIANHTYLDALAIPPGQKSVLHLHGYPAQSNYMHELLTPIPTAFIAVSSLIKIKWQKLADIKKIAVATNGIDSDYFKPNKKTILKYDVIYAGRLIKNKGVVYLIEALAKLKKLPIKTAVAGIGPELSTIKSMVKKNGLDDKVEFLGYVKDKDLPGLYQSALMMALPSYDKEGILTTMLEAASCGRPVITTTACSMSEFLKNGYSGLLVKPQDSNSLAQAIKRLYTNPALADKLGRQARKSIETNWSWTKKIKQVEKIYAQTISGR